MRTNHRFGFGSHLVLIHLVTTLHSFRMRAATSRSSWSNLRGAEGNRTLNPWLAKPVLYR